MINQKDIFADMHTHSIFSLHAYSTIEENLKVAKERNLKYLAVTDHYFQNGDNIQNKNENTRIKYIEERLNAFSDILGVTVIGSAEFNLGQYPERNKYWERLSKLRYRPIGLHSFVCDRESLTYDDVYSMWKDSVKDYSAFVHIERELSVINHKAYGIGINKNHAEFLNKVVELAVQNDILLEVNESTLITNTDNTADRLKYWINVAKDMNAVIVLGTDAHFSLEVGDFTNSIKLLNEVGYPKDLILNCNEDLFKKFLGF